MAALDEPSGSVPDASVGGGIDASGGGGPPDLPAAEPIAIGDDVYRKGKYIKKTAEKIASMIEDRSGPDDQYYAGKHLRNAAIKISTAIGENHEYKQHGQLERVYRPLLMIHHALKGKRTLTRRPSGSDQDGVGKVRVAFIKGSFSCKRPYFIVEVDGHEERTAPALTRTPQWGEGALQHTEFELFVFDPSSDIRIWLFDDAEVHHELPIGRVTIPIKFLCTDALLPMPRPAHRAEFTVMPATKQWSPLLEARYTEAVPHVPGSGMVKPKQELGSIELEFQLTLTAPYSDSLGLLAAYAHATPSGAVQEDAAHSDSEDAGDVPQEEQSPQRLDPKILRGNIRRLKRVLGRPALLSGQQVFAMPVVLFWMCFHARLHHLPWYVFGINLASGIFDHHRIAERSGEMILWEDEVGERDMPKGIGLLLRLKSLLGKLQEILGKAATVLERRQNVMNFADAPITVVATGCTACLATVTSTILYVVPIRTLCFLVGNALLLPHLIREARRKDADKQAAIGGPAVGRAATSVSPAPAVVQNRLRLARACLAHLLRALSNVISRVPDGKDLAHEYFCKQAVLTLR